MRRAALLLLLLAGCEPVNEVRLVVPDDAVGLSCVDSATGDLLIERGVTAGAVEASVVLDYLAFDGVPSCRAVQLVRWCNNRGCPVVQRDCIRVRLSPVPAPEAVREAFGAEVARMSPITFDAPDGVVTVRATLTTQTCEELASGAGGFPELSCDALLACIYSCPVQLDEVSGDVELELDALGTTCTEAEVGICAGIGVGDMNCGS